MEGVAGVILAGGLSSRMGGGDKSLCTLKGKPMISHVIERLREQAAPIAISANGDASRFSAIGLPVIPDATADYAGPLAGVRAGMRWAAQTTPKARWIVTAACDTPFFPTDLVEKLMASASGAFPSIALAASAGRTHPVFGLWPLVLAEDLAFSLDIGIRKVSRWTERHPNTVVEFSFADLGGNPVDPFFNVNTPEDLAEAERLLRTVRTQ